jgi:hypothetical protein
VLPYNSAGQRRYPRNPYKENLEICVPSHPQNETLVAISSNISASGVCIYTFKPLKEGQVIVFKSNLPVPYHRATVRWVKQYNGSIYKVGVLFTE